MNRFDTTWNLDARTAPRAFCRFCRQEDGAVTIFAIFIFFMMVMVAGIGVDVMRFEKERATMQYTLDRAVLAAADLDQPLPPADVVRDYFAKAGLSESLADVTLNETVGSRTVSATASSVLGTYFMKLSGVDFLNVAGVSTAQEAIDAVEISLVLDVSGSMRNYNRLTNLKVAAADFVDEMFDNSQPGTVTISIVPYATQVTVPQALMDQLNTKFRPIDQGVFEALTPEVQAGINAEEAAAEAHARDNNLSLCVHWGADDFNNTTISTSDVYQRALHFDPWDNFDGRDNDPVELVRDPVCEADPSREVILLSDNRTQLKSFINGFFADGNTSLDVGMKWGSILVDPTFRPLVQALSAPAVGLINAAYSNRPVAHDDEETIKVIVLMTDGQNTSQYFINDGYRLGNSNIWWNEQEELYSVYLGEDVEDENGNGLYDDPLYFWPWNNTWQDHAYGEGSYTETETSYECQSWRRNGSCSNYREITTEVTYDEPGSAELLTYPELWAWTSMKRIVTLMYEPFMDDTQAWNDWYYGVRNYIDRSTKNARTQAICGAAKTNGAIVFTIGFESPDASRLLLQNCASSPSHFFDVEGLEIADAFSAIASSIRALRLTQ